MTKMTNRTAGALARLGSQFKVVNLLIAEAPLGAGGRGRLAMGRSRL